MKPKEVTVHMMVKNEEYFIGYILQVLTQFLPHILVMDTGSTDLTISIIKSFPSVVLIEKGEQDRWGLGECRNEMMSMLETDWAWQIDGDEYYPKQSIEAFLKHDMPDGKKLGFTLFYDVGWDGARFRTLTPFSRAAILDSSARYSGDYPFENPDIFNYSELFYYFPDAVWGTHLHHLVRSSEDEKVYLRIQKRHQFSMMDRKVEFGEALEIPFEGDWENPYLDYLRRKIAKRLPNTRSE